ncbi:ABC-three component system protein [Parendozoicomonas sp. Alg238-R29]|uniref:ABC-three component system protein n=1 Tax=Parendozoicomonas sp. Alg238-R29 TaxID=2993446 RepID=UPI00248EFAC2|nr:ABC-three component system protein [Parendozoicomonas sp. Alg238-R29]
MSLFREQTTSASENGIAITNRDGDVKVSIIKSLARLPSILNPLLIKIIEEHRPQNSAESVSFLYPETELKITYNRVINYADDFKEFSGYMSLIEYSLDNIDNEDPGARETFLWALNKKYKNIKKELLIENDIDPSNKDDVIGIIAKNSDRIILKVSKEIISTANGDVTYPIELVQAAQELVVCYGFINCQILEKPDDSIQPSNT